MIEDSPAFVAQASNPELGIEAAQGTIQFDRWRLQFSTAAFSLEIPLARLQIERDESGSGAVFFSDPEQPGWAITTFEPKILSERNLVQQAQTSAQIRGFRTQGEMQRRLKITLGVVVGFALAAMVVSMLLSFMVRSLVAQIPASWEQQMGDSLMAEIRQEETFSDDPKLKARVVRAVNPLLAALPKNGINYKFYVVEDPIPNAFALPGGHVLVNSGLLELAGRPEEIAGVVAHELAHVTQKHGFRKIISAAGPFLIVRLFAGGGGGLVGVLGEGSQLLVRQGFSQEYELEADDIGWKYLVAAHIDPRGFTDMMRKLQADQEKMKHLGLGVQIQAFSSHPATEKRIRRLEAKWQKLKNKSGFINLSEAPQSEADSTR